MDDIFVSVTNEKGNCSVYEMDENSIGRFQKFHEFDNSCTAMEMFEQKDKGEYFELEVNLTIFKSDSKKFKLFIQN